MNWEAISAVGEWTGTIIIIITLIYLARQVHLNTVTNRVAGITGIADAAREIHFTLAGDRDTARIFLVGISNPDELDEIDRGRFELFMWGVLRQMESFHVQYEQGIISEAAMKAYARLSVDLIGSNQVMQKHWQDTTDYSPAFKSWIDEQVAQLGRDTN
jgi:hypothetical protein